jgi:maleate isomerase
MADIYGHRGKIGIVLPSVNTVVETESGPLCPPGVTNHFARISVVERPLTSEHAFLEHVEAMRAGIGGAIDQVVTCRPTHVIMAVALEAFWGGVETATTMQRDLETRTGLGVSMGGSATVAALRNFEVRRLGILTPHMPRGDAMVRLYFEEAGFDIVKLIGLKRGSALSIATTTVEEIRAALHDLAASDIEAIVQVGTNLPMKDMAVAAERWLGKPVLCINVVTYWDALRRMGLADKLHGHGVILERF